MQSRKSDELSIAGNFDVIIVGAGHAGCEAAAAACRIGAKVCLITFDLKNIGATSCNPSMGGIGKTHIMNEIEACDGIMSEITDKSATQKRELNESRGYAVRAMRAILDRDLYHQEALKKMQWYSHNYDLTIIEGEVTDLLLDESNKVQGLEIIKKNIDKVENFYSKTVVITTGTFLNGLIHIGTKTTTAGRIGERASTKLAEKFKNLSEQGILDMQRLKTGTPARIKADTINYAVLEEQERIGDNLFFSSKVKENCVPYLPCFITRTNENTHQIINDNIHLSPMYSGQIESKGPRYCPSIEDKVVRFASRTSHTIFLEREGINSNVIYPSGISTSLPEEVQEKIIHSIKGLENAEIIQYGYAIEYDYCNPKKLTNTLEVQGVDGLFLAGQINGTTGYEEAAGQGLIAGANAALQSQSRPSFVMNRDNSYIGVMIDDLINLGVSEPYRMFTSRAEFRLSMRNDNADFRLTERAYEHGLVGEERYRIFVDRKRRYEEKLSRLKNVTLGSLELQALNTGADGVRKSLFDILGYSMINEENMCNVHEELKNIDLDIVQTIMSEAKYAPYIKRQESETKILSTHYDLVIPLDIDYDALGTMSTEEKEKLKLHKPYNVRGAMSIQGVTPNAVLSIIMWIKRRHSLLTS